MLQHLPGNVERNNLGSIASVAALDWTSPQSCRALVALGPVEWVIGTDLLYNFTGSLLPDLVGTLAFICRQGRGGANGGKSVAGDDREERSGPPCRVVLAYQRRTGDPRRKDPVVDEFLDLALHEGFQVDGPLDLPPEVFEWDLRVVLDGLDDVEGDQDALFTALLNLSEKPLFQQLDPAEAQRFVQVVILTLDANRRRRQRARAKL